MTNSREKSEYTGREYFSIDLYAELDELGVKWEYDNESWVKVLCPFHADKTPSCGIHTDNYNFNCLSCGASGPFEQFAARKLSQPAYVYHEYLRGKYGGGTNDRPIDIDLIESYHRRIWEAQPLLKELYKRGITDASIRAARLGEWKGRITIPIFNAANGCVNVLHYSPGAKDKKFLNTKGRGKPVRIYQLGQLAYSKRLIVGGPIKALALQPELNAAGCGVISLTSGETAKAWTAELVERVANMPDGKPCEWLGICLDIDAAGQAEANRLAMRFHQRQAMPYVLALPLDPADYPKGDPNDWMSLGKPFLPLILAASEAGPWQPARIGLGGRTGSQEQAGQTTIYDAAKASRANQRLEFRGLVGAVESEAYYLPKKVCVTCDRKADFCELCPIYTMPTNPPPIIEIDPETDSLLEMMQTKRAVQSEALRKAIGIPPCKKVRFDTDKFYHAQNLILTQELDTRNGSGDINLHTVSMDCELEINELYALTGRIVPHPNTQRATAIISKVTPVADTLNSFQTDPAQLERFQPTNWSCEAVQAKFDQIYFELENKVTHIWNRRNLHILYDLAYHSVLYFSAEHRTQYGWVQVLVVGDTSHGKSTVASHIQEHYGLGKIIDMANTSVAGLLGGVQQINGRHFVTWGEFPANDRRLVILEELSEARAEIMAKLTDMRSRGIADITKIERKQRQARCRMIAISNSRSGANVNSYAYGVDVIRELIPHLEDIRRFDAFNIVCQTEISPSVMLTQPSLNGNHTPIYDAESCRNLVMWAWTRTPEQIEFESWPYIVEQSAELCNVFTDTVPIIDRGSARFKLAKLAIAVAVRTYSNREDSVLVRNCHVDFIVKYLTECYSTQAFGYDRYSKISKEHLAIKQPDKVKQKILELNFPADFVECILRTQDIEVRDICDWCGCDRGEAQELVSLLVRSHAVTREKSGYKKSAEFIELLRSMSGLAETTVVPNYAKDAL